MSFEVAAEAYDRFMGRFSRHLAPQMLDLAGIRRGQVVIDVGCGPGALTAELVARLGAASVSAADPSPPFVEAVQERLPGVTVVQAAADSLPFDSGAFDAALAQLVVHFMPDPVAGVAEMRRVTRAGGRVAANVWDFAGERAPLSLFWRVARELDPNAVDESRLPGARQGHLVELFRAAGLRDVDEVVHEVVTEHPSFEEWWEPYLAGVGPAGMYLAGRDEAHRHAIAERCRALLPAGPFTLRAHAWAAVGVA